MSAASGGWARLGPPRRRPRTVFDWMIGLSLVAIVAAVVLPHARHAVAERSAREVLAAVYTLQEAAREAAAAGDWLALQDAQPGQMPEGLEPYLPDDFTFDHRAWSLDWDFYGIEGGLRSVIVGDRHGGITVSFDSPELAEHVQGVAGRRMWVRIDNHISFLVPTLDQAGV